MDVINTCRIVVSDKESELIQTRVAVSLQASCVKGLLTRKTARSIFPLFRSSLDALVVLTRRIIVDMGITVGAGLTLEDQPI